MYQSPPGYHRHRCPTCGCVWEHPDICAEAEGVEFDALHECPFCQTLATVRYEGEFEPEVTQSPR